MSRSSTLRYLLAATMMATACDPSQANNAAEPQVTADATASADGASKDGASADMASPEPSTLPAETTPSASASVKASAEPAKVATKPFALAEFKLPLSIELAETAKLEKNESKDKLGGVNIDGAAGAFGVRVFAAPGDMATAAGIKAKLTKMVRPAEKFLKEEADLLVYVRKGGGIEFLTRTTIAGKVYLCQARDEADAAEKLEPVIAACKTLKKAP